MQGYFDAILVVFIAWVQVSYHYIGNTYYSLSKKKDTSPPFMNRDNTIYMTWFKYNNPIPYEYMYPPVLKNMGIEKPWQ